MVARINIRKSIQKALNYNEAKVLTGVGEILLASGFGCDIADLSFHDKLNRFELLNQRNEWVKKNTLHISLNFPVGEDLPPETLQRLALDYMDRIGFGEQPFIVYQHHDAKHPHIHIVTTSIRPDGKSVDLHNIGKELSEPVREALEEEYGLTRARGRQYHLDSTESSDLAAKVQEVTGSYKFTSLDELNAILAQFEMTAWIGAPGSAIRSNHGLVYSRIDADGNRKGTPIKSSDLVTRPTLTWLEKRFELNKVKKLPIRDRVAQTLTSALAVGDGNPMTIFQRLKQRRLSLQPRRDDAGNLISVHVIDNHNKVVFTAEELSFELDALIIRLGLPTGPTPVSESDALNSAISATKVSRKAKRSHGSQTPLPPQRTAIAAQIAFALIASQTGAPGPAGDEPPKKKKRKKRSF